jgi:hypothetical protein
VEIQEAFAEMRRNLLDKQSGRLAEAAGVPVDEAVRHAIRDVAAECRPDTIDTLVALLRGLRAVAPHRIAAYPVVAFVRYGRADGMQPTRGVAITADNNDRANAHRSSTHRFNVHTVCGEESTARWERQNGRYGMTWEAARQEMNSRADGEPQP